MQDVLGDGGILKEVVREGEGPLVPRDASVSSKYQTWHHRLSDPINTNIVLLELVKVYHYPHDEHICHVRLIDSPLFWIPGVFGSAFWVDKEFQVSQNDEAWKR